MWIKTWIWVAALLTLAGCADVGLHNHREPGSDDGNIGDDDNAENNGTNDNSTDNNGANNNGTDNNGAVNNDAVPEFEPAPATLHRLTSDEYRAVVHDLIAAKTKEEGSDGGAAARKSPRLLEESQSGVRTQASEDERGMTKDNNMFGEYHLDGIPAAPCGAPQVEVTLGFGANDILNVSAQEVGMEVMTEVTAIR